MPNNGLSKIDRRSISLNFSIEMGYFKELEIERMEDPFYDAPTNLVGATLFENRLLKESFAKYGTQGVCSYSGNNDLVMPLKDIIIEIYEIVMSHYGDADNEGVGWDSHFDKDEDDDTPGFYKGGGGYIIPENRSYYTDASELLSENGLIVKNEQLWNDIVFSFPSVNLVEKDPYGLNEGEEREIDWREISQNALDWKENDFDYPNLPIVNRTQLFNLLQTMHSLGDYVFRIQEFELYRNVNYKTPFPDGPEFTNLTSPPIDFTQDLRMSPKGVSMFYGASSFDTAINEAISHGEKVCAYTGTFRTKHPLLVLDLRRLQDRISIFDVNPSVYHIVLFLQHFAREISKPVHGDTRLYAPTQFITTFFRSHLKVHYPDGTSQPIQGVLYDSSKNPDDWNAALFFDNTDSKNVLDLISWKLTDTRD